MGNKLASARLARLIKEGIEGIKDFNLLYDTPFIWDTYCNIRRVGRFIRRLYIYVPQLWNNENWDFGYTLDLVILQLSEMEKAQKEDDIHMHSDRRARKIREVIEHFKRYRDIDKYTIDVDCDEYLNNHAQEPYSKKTVKETAFGLSFQKSFPFIKIGEFETGKEAEEVTLYRMFERDEKLAKKHKIIHDRQHKLEEWHWSEGWKKISKYSRGWWC